MSPLFRVLVVLLLPWGLFASETKAPVYTVAFVQDNMANDFRRAQVFEARRSAENHPELRFVFSDAKGQTSLMIRQIQNFVHEKVDALIVGTTDAKAVVPALSDAYAKGVPIVLIGRGVEGKSYTTFIHPDNEKIGAAAAAYMAKALGGKGKVLILEGIPNIDVTELRTKGFTDVMARYPGITTVRRTANFLRKDAIYVMERLLEENVRFDAVYSHSDSMLSGVRMVFQRHGIEPSMMLMVGVDYITEAQEAIRSGKQDSTFLYPLCGKEAIDAVRSLLKGRSVPREIIIPTEHITKERIDAVRPIF